MKISTDKKLIAELLTRSIEKVYPTSAELEKELASGRRLRIYLGIDPTSPHLHLGHAVTLFALRRFQALGHEVVLLIGDFTARIGDPTDKLSPRQPLSKAQVQANLKTLKKQAAKILSFTGENAAQLRFNSKWHDKMTFGELITLAQNFSIQQLEERDMFERRRKEGKTISLSEFLYPLSQGYDSVALDVDVEVGGSDQIFNMLAGRTLMKTLKHKEKFVIATKLLVDTASGKKLSKTEGSLVNLDDEPNDMFGRVMAMPDGMIAAVAELSTPMPLDAVKALAGVKNPRDAKLRVAEEVVKTYHSEKAADAARENWVRTFSKKEGPTDAPTLTIKKSIVLIDLVVVAGTPSRGEARRLIAGKAVSINDVVHADPNSAPALKGGEVLKIGKHRFFKLKVK